MVDFSKYKDSIQKEVADISITEALSNPLSDRTSVSLGGLHNYTQEM